MRITEVRMTAFKGQDRSVAIAPRTLLTGPNGSGKSAVLEAVTAAILGYVPGYGKRATAGLASGSTMVAGVTAEGPDGRHFCVDRTWHLGDSVKESLLLDPPMRGSLAAKNARIAEVLGACPTMIAVDTFLDLTPGKRAEQLRELVSGSATERSVDELLDELSGLELGAGIEADIKQAWRAEASEADNLDRVLDVVAARASKWAGHEHEAAAAVSRLLERVGEHYSDPRSVPDLRRERDELLALIGDIRAEMAADEERGKATDQARRAVQVAEQWRAAAEEERKTAARALDEAQRLAEQARTALDEAEAMPAPPVVAIGAPELERAKDRAYSELGLAEERLRQAEDRLAEERTRHEAWESARGCPVAAGVACPASVDVDTAISDRLAELGRAVDEAARVRTQASRAYDDATDVYHEACETQRQAAANANTKRQDRERAIALARAKLTDAQRQHHSSQGLMETAARHVEQCEQDRLAAERTLAEAPGRIDREMTARTIGVHTTTARQLDDIIAAKERARSLEQELIKAEAAAAEAASNARTLRALQSALKSIAAAASASAFGPLTDAVTGLLEAVRPGWRIEVRPERGGVTLYASTGGDPIPWVVLSRGERAISGAGLALALVRLHEPPSKLLLLEAAEVDPENLPALLRALGAMGQDFDTIIVATCHGASCEGWSVINMADVGVSSSGGSRR